MRKLIIVFVLALASGTLNAQEVLERIVERDIKNELERVEQERERLIWVHGKEKQQPPKTFSAKVGTKKIAFVMNLRKLTIEAHSGSEVVIEATGVKPPNERAKGLTPVYNDQIDNTGVGLSMINEGNEVRFRQAAGQNRVRYKIKVPRDNDLSVQMGWSASELSIDGCAGEIEVNLQTGDLDMKNIKGPVVAHSISGNIEAQFSNLSQKGPTSLQSVSGFVDVTLPKSVSASISMNTTTGQIYVTNPKTIVKKERDEKKEGFIFSGMPQNVKAQMNGGGAKFSLESVSGDVYLREK